MNEIADINPGINSSGCFCKYANCWSNLKCILINAAHKRRSKKACRCVSRRPKCLRIRRKETFQCKCNRDACVREIIPLGCGPPMTPPCGFQSFQNTPKIITPTSTPKPTLRSESAKVQAVTKICTVPKSPVLKPCTCPTNNILDRSNLRSEPVQTTSKSPVLKPCTCSSDKSPDLTLRTTGTAPICPYKSPGLCQRTPKAFVSPKPVLSCACKGVNTEPMKIPTTRSSTIPKRSSCSPKRSPSPQKSPKKASKSVNVACRKPETRSVTTETYVLCPAAMQTSPEDLDLKPISRDRSPSPDSERYCICYGGQGESPDRKNVCRFTVDAYFA